ncbi:MAG TPA: hypothetical protein VEF36_05075, partial [Roseiarcus sp.]|nr:hypothetical protein [Roseiarcus sp.]
LVQEIGAMRNPPCARARRGRGLILQARQSKLAIGQGKAIAGPARAIKAQRGVERINAGRNAPPWENRSSLGWNGRMDSLEIAFLVGVLAFVSGLIGLKLQLLLPDHHTSDRSRDMIAAISGLLGLLLALVLGTLIGASYSFYATQKAELETLDARALQYDSALAAYGPEAQPGRDGLKKAIQQGYDMFWGAGQSDPKAQSVAVALAGLKKMDHFLLSLTPTTDAQKQLLTTASVNASWIEQTRLLMSLQLAAPIPWPLIIIVVSWSLLLFCGYGLLSRLNATVVATLALGSFAVASAIFLIIELNQPYTGLFRISPAVIMQTLDALGG